MFEKRYKVGGKGGFCVAKILRKYSKLRIPYVHRMQNLFIGLNKIDLAAVKQFKLKALALLLVFIVKGTNQSARALCHYFLTQVEDVNRYYLCYNLRGWKVVIKNSVEFILNFQR